jgi:predicted amidohydrolase YtcJ
MKPDRLFLNATVLTLDPAERVAEGVAVAGDRIVATGSPRELRARAAAGAREIDLGGGTLIPGFVDAHSHMVMVGDNDLYAVDLNSPPIGEVKTLADLVARLRSRADATPAGEWVVAAGYDDTLLMEGRHPTRADLDRASTAHPIVARHVSGHLAAANSRALALGEVTRETPDPAGGVIRRDASGEPDGVLEESALFAVLGRIPPRSPEQRIAAVERGARVYAERGLTTAQRPGPDAMQRVRDGSLELETPVDRLTPGAIKLFADGSIQGYTGHLCEPYHVPFKGQPAYRGYAAMARDDLVTAVSAAYAAGRQVAVHTNGDAAIDDFLYAVARANEAHPRPDARPIAVHAQMTREDQLREMRRLGVVPSFFCLHTYYWGDRHRDIFLGPERARRISPTRSAVELGLRFTIHTDAPVVPMDPMLLMWAAVNRKTTAGHVLGPEQRLTPLEALRATTIDAAWQLELEQTRGSIEPGKLADFALLDASPLDDPEAIRDVRVLASFVGGERVHG